MAPTIVCGEGDVTELYRTSGMHPHALIGSIASLYARWDVPVLFIGNAAGAGRLIAGILKRWEERLTAMLRDGGILIDIKSVMDPKAVPEKIRYWSL